ncbi:hypothetical protein JQ615_17640 [Bradyrhizobium jicamae]|uniref:Uncharacterized protein n=1 Tax=Bradyrhizobium jicamae TaxID=280332 RepID=A0ABS5FKB7_9BRAD|nr:hypothetical protein [Bradyrhizobium jicamae]MBR0797218.1 hypothetical protein [Bradyrhizobium jicamae]MBR0938235.1 hypothetical protein [Bradyrhizobium jicamae]
MARGFRPRPEIAEASAAIQKDLVRILHLKAAQIFNEATPMNSVSVRETASAFNKAFDAFC